MSHNSRQKHPNDIIHTYLESLLNSLSFGPHINGCYWSKTKITLNCLKIVITSLLRNKTLFWYKLPSWHVVFDAYSNETEIFWFLSKLAILHIEQGLRCFVQFSTYASVPTHSKFFWWGYFWCLTILCSRNFKIRKFYTF